MRRFLLLGVFAVACAKKPAPEVKIDPALAILVPADTVLMVGTHVEALQKTPVFDKYLVSVSQIEEFARLTGIDPRKNLWELLFVSNGKKGMLLGRGKFANEEEPRLEHDGARRFGYKGFNLIGNDQGAVLLINSSTAAVGEIAALEALIDQREKTPGPPAALAALMQDIPPEAQFWAAYAGGALDLPLPGNLANVNKLLGSLQSGSAYFDLRTGLKGVVSGACSTEQEAQNVAGALKFLLAMSNLSVPSLQVTQNARRVKLSIDEPPERVEKVFDLWMQR